MTTNDRSVLDTFLTGHSNAFVNPDDWYIAEKILPPVSVGQTTGKVAGYGTEHLRIVNTVHRGKGEYLEVDTQVRSSQDYEIIDHGLKEIITENDRRNAISPYQVEIDVTMALTSMQMQAKEKALADTLFSPSVITQTTTLSGNAQYSERDHADSDPVGDKIVASAAVKDATGTIVNAAVMNWETYQNLRFHHQLLDKLGYKYDRAGGMSLQELAFALDLEKIFIGKATYVSSKRGQTDTFANIWGNHLLYCYIAPQIGLRQKTLGIEVRKNKTSPREVYKWANKEPVNSDTISVLDNYDQLILNATCGYLIQNAIA